MNDIASMPWRTDRSIETITIKIIQFRNHDRNQELSLSEKVQGFLEYAVSSAVLPLTLIPTFTSIIRFDDFKKEHLFNDKK